MPTSTQTGLFPAEFARDYLTRLTELIQKSPPRVQSHMAQWGGFRQSDGSIIPPLLAASSLAPDDVELIRPFLERGLDVNVQYHGLQEGDLTPLGAAVGRAGANLRLLDLYWDYGLQVDTTSAMTGSPLFWAAQLGDMATVIWLWKHGADPDQVVQPERFSLPALKEKWKAVHRADPAFKPTVRWMVDEMHAAVDAEHKIKFAVMQGVFAKPRPQPPARALLDEAIAELQATHRNALHGAYMTNWNQLIDGETFLTRAILSMEGFDPCASASASGKLTPEYENKRHLLDLINEVVHNKRPYLGCESRDQYTPLAAAVHIGALPWVKSLLLAGADPKIQVRCRKQGASKGSLMPLLELAKISGDKKDAENIKQLQAVIRQAKKGVLSADEASKPAQPTLREQPSLLVVSPDLELDGRLLIQHAISTRDASWLQRLLASGCDVDVLPAATQTSVPLRALIKQYHPTFGSDKWDAERAARKAAAAACTASDAVMAAAGQAETMAAPAAKNVETGTVSTPDKNVEPETSSAEITPVTVPVPVPVPVPAHAHAESEVAAKTEPMAITTVSSSEPEPEPVAETMPRKGWANSDEQTVPTQSSLAQTELAVAPSVELQSKLRLMAQISKRSSQASEPATASIKQGADQQMPKPFTRTTKPPRLRGKRGPRGMQREMTGEYAVPQQAFQTPHSRTAHTDPVLVDPALLPTARNEAEKQTPVVAANVARAMNALARQSARTTSQDVSESPAPEHASPALPALPAVSVEPQLPTRPKLDPNAEPFEPESLPAQRPMPLPSVEQQLQMTQNSMAHLLEINAALQAQLAYQASVMHHMQGVLSSICMPPMPHDLGFHGGARPYPSMPHGSHAHMPYPHPHGYPPRPPRDVSHDQGSGGRGFSSHPPY